MALLWAQRHPQGLMLKLLPELNSQRLYLETGPLKRRLGTRAAGGGGVIRVALIQSDNGPIRTDQNTGTHTEDQLCKGIRR